MRFMNRSGIQFAVFMSCVRRRSSPVFLRSSRNSKMSLCHVSRYAQPGALAFAALVDGDELVVVQLQERNDALRFAIGATDVGAGAANRGPGAAEAAGPLGEERVLRDAAEHDALDRVVDVVEIAGRELRVERAGVEERRRAGAEAAAL